MYVPDESEKRHSLVQDLPTPSGHPCLSLTKPILCLSSLPEVACLDHTVMPNVVNSEVFKAHNFAVVKMCGKLLDAWQAMCKINASIVKGKRGLRMGGGRTDTHHNG